MRSGSHRLLPRRLAKLLNTVNPNSVALDAVAEALKSDDFFVRYNAGKLLSKRGDRDARLLCENTLKTGDPLARASVARNLHGFSWYTGEPLYHLALADADLRVGEAAVYSLCDLGGLNAYQLLAQALPGQVDDVLEAAAVGLRDCQDPAAVPALQAVVQAKDPDVRVKGVEALAATDMPEALPLVEQVLRQDSSMSVCYAATLSYLELARDNGLPTLAGLIQAEDSLRRLYLLKGFFHAVNYLNLKVAESDHALALFNALHTALRDELPETRIAAIWPLAWWWRDDTSGQALLAAYQAETSTQVRAEMLRITVKLMTGVGETILADALHSEDACLREEAEGIAAHRDQVGMTLSYDDQADDGTGMSHPLIGR